jgi:hypothetical protein
MRPIVVGFGGFLLFLSLALFMMIFEIDEYYVAKTALSGFAALITCAAIEVFVIIFENRK